MIIKESSNEANASRYIKNSRNCSKCFMDLANISISAVARKTIAVIFNAAKN